MVSNKSDARGYKGGGVNLEYVMRDLSHGALYEEEISLYRYVKLLSISHYGNAQCART